MGSVVVVSVPLVVVILIVALVCYILGRSKGRREAQNQMMVAPPVYGAGVPPPPPPPQPISLQWRKTDLNSNNKLGRTLALDGLGVTQSLSLYLDAKCRAHSQKYCGSKLGPSPY
ncbi:hypothetical protein EJ110_NYTH03895 [Nymphaea thermarum]|nr:hypothetical protein EJ110_NYTH03895 [Nymphaea thermarum]